MATLLSRGIATTLALLLCATSPGSPGAVLVSFDFDDPLGQFEALPQFLHPGLASALFSDDAGTLTDFAGAGDGRALAASAFTAGNRIRLALQAAPGNAVTPTGLQFDLRASASGPQQWLLEVDDVAIASGATATTFETVVVALPALPAASAFVIALGGDGASSSRGTLRLDNFALSGSVSALPLAGALPLLGAALLVTAACARGARRG